MVITNHAVLLTIVVIVSIQLSQGANAPTDPWPQCVVNDGSNKPYADVECLPECKPENRFIKGLCHDGLTCCKMGSGLPGSSGSLGSRPFEELMTKAIEMAQQYRYPYPK